MTRAELNKLPTVRPALEAWRAARAERDRVTLDRRYGAEAQRRAECEAQIAENVYEAAIKATELPEDE